MLFHLVVSIGPYISKKEEIIIEDNSATKTAEPNTHILGSLEYTLQFCLASSSANTFNNQCPLKWFEDAVSSNASKD